MLPRPAASKNGSRGAWNGSMPAAWLSNRLACSLVDDQEEVGVEGERLAGARLGALRDDDRVGVRGVEPVADLAPERGGQPRARSSTRRP